MNEKKITVTALIEAASQAAAKAAAQEVLRLQHQQHSVSFYCATEALLRSYPRIRQLITNPDRYGFFKLEKSHDITVAPPVGTVFRDKVELAEEYTEARKKSFARTLTRFAELDAVVRLFENRREFIVIRMYYFGEDEYGNYRGDDAKRYTFAEISEALSYIGIDWSERACRYRRASLVREMTVMLFGADGAVSLAHLAQEENKATGKGMIESV